MKLVFQNKRIAGILTVMPEKESYFDDEVNNYSFPAKQTMKLKKIMGYEKHRLVKETTASSDLCIYGIQHLIDNSLLNLNDIGAIVVVTLTPDHFVPHVSNIIQGHFDMSNDVLCMDVLQGCCGYEMGLLEAFMLLEHMPNKKVLLCNVDTLSKKTSKQDRNSFPLIGDAASITVVENGVSSSIYFNIKMDGKRSKVLSIPAGGSRMPCSETTATMTKDATGNVRSLDNLVMDGTGVFEFVIHDVPPMIADTIEFAGIKSDIIDWFVFHQPNKFILQKLIQNLKIPTKKVPINIVESFGNSSGVTVPVTITYDLAEDLLSNERKCCLSAFGSGLTWCAVIMDIGKLKFCSMVFSDL